MAKTFDVIVRFETVAEDQKSAIENLKAEEKAGYLLRGAHIGFETIRDDSLFNGSKDFLSQNINGFVVLSSEEKHQLLSQIHDAVEAARQGDLSKSNSLMNNLTQRFDYMSNRSVPQTKS